MRKLRLFIANLFIMLFVSSYLVLETSASGPVTNQTTGESFSTISGAINSVESGESAVFVLDDINFNESITLNRNVEITLTSNTGIINGNITVTTGTLHLDNVEIKGQLTYTGNNSLGSIRNSKISTTTQDCIQVTQGAKLLGITDTEIVCKDDCIEMSSGARVDEINRVSILIDSSDVDIDTFYIVDSSIGSIQNTTMIGNGYTAKGILLHNSTINVYDNVTMELDAQVNVEAVRLDKPSTIGSITNSSFDICGKGHMYGIWLINGGIESIENTNINLENNGPSFAFALYNQGTIDTISDCVITTTGTSNRSIGVNTVGPESSIDPRYPARINSVVNTTITGKSYAFGVQQDGYVKELRNNHFYSTRSEYGAILLSSGGTIEEIKSGTYASKGSAVLIYYGSNADVASGKRGGELKKISYDETTNQAPIFYGEAGWAINANTQGPAPTIIIEDNLNTDQPLIGYARYYGGATKVVGKGNGDAIIGTTNKERNSDTYPGFTDAYAEETSQDPKNYPYYFSVDGVDTSVSDEVLKQITGLDISGKTFHYLTVKARLKYDPNADVEDKEVMDPYKVVKEYNTYTEVKNNLYVRKNYLFKEWNTKADGTGDSYKASDEILLNKQLTTLYAIWQEPVKVNITGKKELTGSRQTKDIKQDEFTFILEPALSNPIELESSKHGVKEKGGIDLGELELSLPGKYSFTIKEEDLKKKGYTYDSSVYEYVLTVGLNRGTNKLEIVEGPVILKDGNEVEKIVFSNKYVVSKYNITYKLNGGTYNGSSNDIVETYDEGAVIKIHEKPQRPGYTFLYWEGSRYNPGQNYTVVDNHVFTAQWQKVAPVVPNTSDSINLLQWSIILVVSLIGISTSIGMIKRYY